jgi:hypothetical protein
MADLGNSTRSDRNKPAKHNFRYAYVLVLLSVNAVIRQLGSAMKMQRSHYAFVRRSQRRKNSTILIVSPTRVRSRRLRRSLHRRIAQSRRTGDVEIAGIGSLDLNVDRCGETEVENLGNHVRRLEVEGHSREFLRQLPAQRLDVRFRGSMVLLIQRYEDFSVEGTDVGSKAKGEVDGILGKADIVENQIQLIAWNHLTDVLLDLTEEDRRLLDTVPGMVRTCNRN